MRAVEAQALLLAPGCELAVRTPPGAGEDGCDIFGQTLPAPVQEARVRAGVNVREEGERILADAYGYVWIGDDRISVLPPVGVSADRMQAHFVHFPQAGEQCAPRVDWIADALRRRGIQYGVEQDRIAALCQAPPPAPDTFTCLLASGTSPSSSPVAGLCEASVFPDELGDHLPPM